MTLIELKHNDGFKYAIFLENVLYISPSIVESERHTFSQIKFTAGNFIQVPIPYENIIIQLEKLGIEKKEIKNGV